MLPGGSSTDYAYDPLMQTASITAKDPGQNPVMTRSYQYSPAGNINAKNTEHGNYAYQYDNLYRLTEAINSSADDEAYTYDLLGNRLTAADTGGDWDYNANNELLGYDDVTFNYDDNGNMTQKAVGTDEVNYSYDIENRLIEVKDGNDALIASYYYDPFGRRLWKEVDGARTYFLYSDEGLIGEYDSTGQEIKTYGWASHSLWSTDPLFQKIGSTYYWYQNDHLGTPQKITTTSGAVVWSAVYDSFGNCQIGTETITNNLRFAGQYYDQETGLYYNLNRYYDPTIGRYLRTDPFGQGLNLYSYCFNNPHSWIDPYGLCEAKKAWNWWSDVATTTWDYWKNKPKEAWNQTQEDLRALSETDLSDLGPGVLFGAGLTLTITGSELTVQGVGIIALGGPVGWIGGAAVTAAGLTTTAIGGWAIYKSWVLMKN